jgi:hypothetical protein
MTGMFGGEKNLSTPKIIARIKGGLGNQLFCYAAARRLASINHAELVLDTVTGYSRDRQYRRQYMLDRFRIPARKATPAERLQPFERWRRAAMRGVSRMRPFTERPYLKQEGIDFDERILTLKVHRKLYLDGLWQSERYFQDVKAVIRKDLRIIPPTDGPNIRMAEKIRRTQAVAMHVRWFDPPGTEEVHNSSVDYYRRAVAMMEERLSTPRYFIFSDDPDAARIKLILPEGRSAFVSHNRGDENAYADLWLMSQCRHFITANSTFSWWGAWLGETEDTIIVCPASLIGEGKITAWNFAGQIPDRWLKI